MKEREKENFEDKDRADILLVVNMFLTGFDAKKINTLYVDKNLQYHGLIQAYSRTNRILGELKSQGNIVCFRNLKDNTDKAIALFSNENAKEQIFIEPYPHYIEQFNKGVEQLKNIAPTPNDVNNLISEEDKLEYVKTFRELIRLLNVSKSFTEFSFNNLHLDEQDFEDYKSKYLDIYDSTRKRAEDGNTSPVNEIDFELELIQRDEINVAYILRLLADLQRDSKTIDKQIQYQEKKAQIIEIMGKEAQLRDKREIIEKFIENNIPQLKPNDNLGQIFSKFWHQERKEALKKLCEEEKLKENNIHEMINAYHFTGKKPLRDTVLNACLQKPKLLQRKKIFERVVTKLMDIIHCFDHDLGEFEEVT